MATIRNFFEYPGDLDDDYPQTNNKSSWISLSFFGQPTYNDVDGINTESQYMNSGNNRYYSLDELGQNINIPSEDEVIDFYMQHIFNAENPSTTKYPNGKGYDQQRGKYGYYRDGITPGVLYGPGFAYEPNKKYLDKYLDERGQITKENLLQAVKDKFKSEGVFDALVEKLKGMSKNYSKIPKEWYAGLLDMYWQLQNNFFNPRKKTTTYKNLFEALSNLDLDNIRANHKVCVKWGTKNGEKVCLKYDDRRVNFRDQNFFIPIKS